MTDSRGGSSTEPAHGIKTMNDEIFDSAYADADKTALRPHLNGSRGPGEGDGVPAPGPSIEAEPPHHVAIFDPGALLIQLERCYGRAYQFEPGTAASVRIAGDARPVGESPSGVPRFRRGHRPGRSLRGALDVVRRRALSSAYPDARATWDRQNARFEGNREGARGRLACFLLRDQ